MIDEVIFTGSIPQCPHCKKPTKRSGALKGVTAMYFTPTYNEKGENINPDRNITTASYRCLECNQSYTITGNETDGYKYKAN